MIGKQSVVVVTQRSFHPGKQMLKISQGTVKQGLLVVFFCSKGCLG